MKSGRTGEIVQVTGPAPYIYRLRVVTGPDEPPIMLYRYAPELPRAATSVSWTT
ncbi:hypothetical protein [Streptomyces sp. WMMB303]|uniref:hypothetical protein n=1 Tax=Streptomyces sp. WMMB303 TaxID=3034154 RepID=UPI0023ED4844|nr:hypothetical protein [Streptomyces sp. WMMB303]MDF4252308.1 hypothetical protein [Streptomyces sp. WMMB303]